MRVRTILGIVHFTFSERVTIEITVRFQYKKKTTIKVFRQIQQNLGIQKLQVIWFEHYFTTKKKITLQKILMFCRM